MSYRIYWAILLGVVGLVMVDGRAHAAVAPGERHLAELNCTACHEAPQPVLARLASTKAPVLGEAGLDLTPQWIRAHLLNPQSEKPGSAMPDVLHALPEAEKRETADALTHYLISLQKKKDVAQAGYSTAVVNAGKGLFHSVGCVACHAPQDGPNTKDGGKNDVQADLDKLAKESIPLGNLAKKFTVPELVEFLRDPLKTRGSGRMPSLNLGAGEAGAIATYLLREQAPKGPATKISGLKYEYYEGNWNNLPQFDKIKVVDSGVIDVFTLKIAKKKENYALRFQGVIQIAADGEYTFWTVSDDGTHLFIDEKRLIDNDGAHPAQEKEGKVTLKAGDHAIKVTFFQGGGGAEFKVFWKGPGFERQEIPAKVLFHEGQPMKPLDEEAFTVDAAKAAKGKDYFAKFNCAACHTSQKVPGVKAKPLAQLTAGGGCVGATPPAGAPKYTLNDEQRVALLEQLKNQTSLSEVLSPKDQIVRTMTALNCVACHQREKKGGPVAFRREYFSTNGEVDLGDEGVMPPHLTGVGNKLKSDWFKKVLWGGTAGAVRPYMATRMPQFGQANVEHLIAAFESADAPEKAWPEATQDETLVKHGQKLVGTQGLSCVACHVFAGRPSLGVPALDITQSFERLKPGWFYAYLTNPQVLRPGTRMPEFWPDGVAANKAILGGDMPKQISAIWSYLSKGKNAEVPVGLHTAKMEIVADKEAVIYRHFIEGSGSRAIGVGYPEKANLTFDANDVRLAEIWQGGFIDAAKHRSGRGTGYEKPLGSNLYALPKGAPFAVLAAADAKWPAESGKAAGYQFRGYTLDDKQRPAFKYEFSGVKVEDFPVVLAAEPDSSIKRTITLKSDKGPANLYFRAATGTIVEKDGAFLIDGKVRMKIEGQKPLLRSIDGKNELLVPIVFQGNEAKFVEEITW